MPIRLGAADSQPAQAPSTQSFSAQAMAPTQTQNADLAIAGPALSMLPQQQ